MELIDREALIEAVNIQLQNALDGANITGMTLFKQKATDCKNFIALIKEMPTVEPQKGEWEKYPSDFYRRCSVCKREYIVLELSKANFCPHCGCDMRSGAK